MSWPYDRQFSPMVRYIKRTIQLNKDIRRLFGHTLEGHLELMLLGNGMAGVRVPTDQLVPGAGEVDGGMEGLCRRSGLDFKSRYSAMDNTWTVELRFHREEW